MSESIGSRRDFLQKVGTAVVVGGAAGVLLGRPDIAEAQAATPPKPTVAPPTLTPAEATATRTAKQVEIEATSQAIEQQKRDAFYAKQTAIASTPAPRPTEKPTGAGTTNPNIENSTPQDPNLGLKLAGGGVAVGLGLAATSIAIKNRLGGDGSSGEQRPKPPGEITPVATQGQKEKFGWASWLKRGKRKGSAERRVTGGRVLIQQPDGSWIPETDVAGVAPTRNTGSAATIPAGVETVSEAIRQQHEQFTQQMLYVFTQQLLKGDITPEDYKRLSQALFEQGSAPVPGNAGSAVSPTPDVPATSAATPPASPAHPAPVEVGAGQLDRARVVLPNIQEEDVEVVVPAGLFDRVEKVRLKGRPGLVIRKAPEEGRYIENSKELLREELAANLKIMEKGVRRVAKLVGIGPGPTLYKEDIPIFEIDQSFPPADGSRLSDSEIAKIGRAHFALEVANTAAELHKANIVLNGIYKFIPTIERNSDGSWQFLTKVDAKSAVFGDDPYSLSYGMERGTIDSFNSIIFSFGLPDFPTGRYSFTKTDKIPIEEERRVWLEKLKSKTLQPDLKKLCEDFANNSADKPKNGVELLERLKPFFYSLGLKDEVKGNGEPPRSP